MSPSVNRATDPKQRDIDVENKLRLYGTYIGFANGKLPSNKQIDVALTSFTSHKKLKTPNKNLSPEGKVLIEDFRNVVDEAKLLLLTKNHDQALQEFIYNTTQLGQKGGPQTAAPGLPVTRDAATQDQQELLAGMKTLGQLIITNGQFRKLLNDAAILLRDVAGDAATKAATRINPSDEELGQVDHPAADNQWHEAPNFSRENLKGQFRDQYNQNKPFGRGDVREVAGNATQQADPAGSRDPTTVADRAQHEQRYGSEGGIDAERGLRSGVQELRERADQNIPEERKQQGKEYRERTRNYAQSKFPQDRRDQTILRLKKMVVEIQGHQDYNQAIDTLLKLAENYQGHGKNLATGSAGTVQGARKDTHLGAAEQNLKVLIERFANNTSADDFLEALNDIYRDADRDPELKGWFRQVDSYLRRCLKEQGYILRDSANDEYQRLYDHGNFLLRNRYRDHTDRLMDEVRFMGDQFSQDPDNQRFGQAMQKLFNDLGNDENGKPVFKKHLIKDITQVIIPELFESTRYVPLPRIEYSDPAIDAIVENLVIESDNLMPNVLEIGNDSYFRWGRKSISNKSRQQFMVSASQIQCDLRDVSYYIKRKQGFPSISDIGVADVFLGGEGFSFKLQLASASKTDQAKFFKVENVTVSIKNMDIKLKQSKHKVLFRILKPLLLKIMKPALTKILEQQIKSTFSDLDALCYRIHLEQQKVQSELKSNPDPETAQNVYNRYFRAVQRELTSRKQKAAAASADKKVNVAITHQESIFKDIKLPGGISTRATELKTLATSGDRWYSEIFNIGSASPTTSIPSPAPITRKSPHSNRRSVRDRETASAISGISRDSGYQGDSSAATAGAYAGGSAVPPQGGRLEEERYDDGVRNNGYQNGHGGRGYMLNKGAEQQQQGQGGYGGRGQVEQQQQQVPVGGAYGVRS